jgi:Zn finger protein HypA/HybF involved in hydrogenase expression
MQGGCRLFKECPHPDDKQRLKLSQELGLKPRQVKFWFQNRRTQTKAQQDRAENVLLRAENESLKGENIRLQAAIRNVVCPNCGHAAVLGEMSYEEQQLRIDNARLKDEVRALYLLDAPTRLNPKHCLFILLFLVSKQPWTSNN